MTSTVPASARPIVPIDPTRRFRTLPRPRTAIVAVCAVATLFVPFVFDSFQVLQAATVLVWIIAAVSLNLLSGFGGILSVGAGAFVGIGAYVSAILRVDLGVPFALSVAAAALFCFVVGFLVGLPALRLRGLYLALVTLGLASCLPLVLKRFDGLTGGVQGFVVEALPDSVGLASDQVTYLSIWIVCGIALASVFLLVHGAAGRAVTGVRDNEIVASSFGVNPARVKELLFGVSSAIGGAAGACYVATVGYVAPDAFPLHLSVVLLIACVVGGLRTVGGAVVAGLFIVYAPLMIDSFIGQAFADVVYGVIVILVLLVAPGGVAGEWQHRRARRVLSGTTGPSPDLQEGEK